MKWVPLLAALISSLCLAEVASADVGCVPNESFDQVAFSGEVSGTRDFIARSGYRRLALRRHDTGWRIEVLRPDRSIAPSRSASRGLPTGDSLQISGRDFRNATNTASVRGRIIRKFIFGNDALDPALNPDLRVPAAPLDEPVNAITVKPVEGEMGIGELIIEDIGLADLGAGRTPRLTYLKFSACLGWEAQERGYGWRGSADPGVPDDVILAMRQCGFDETQFVLSDHVRSWGERGSRAALEPDMTGDGITELVVPVRQTATDLHGLAICLRPDNRLVMAGFDKRTQDVATFVERGDFWRANTAPVRPGGLYPRAAGEGVTLGMIRGPGLFIYLADDETLQLKRQDGR